MSLRQSLPTVVLAVLLVLGGKRNILAQHLEQRSASAPAGVIFVVGGVGGWDVLGCSATMAFDRAGLPHEVRDFVWTHGWGQWLKDLQDSRYLLKKAEELATEIRRVRTQFPNRPIFLIAKSGGAGLALQAAERLPSGTLTTVVLLSAAVAPEYDLRKALEATQKEIVSYYSPHDRLVLDWGTRQFGTIDRVYGPSAGLCGFQVPGTLDEAGRALYSRLRQIRWSPHMIREGYLGGHLSTSFPSFLKAEVAQWLH